jgi:hypothetical protein
VKQKIIHHKLELLILLVVITTSLFFRFANYGERWTLSQDQARDGIIGLHMVQNFTLPLIGPPSSAGTFSFGPFYYWMIGLFTLIIPLVNGPWIGFTLLSVFTPVIFYYIGKSFGQKIYGLIFGLLASFCSELVFHSTDMLNPVPLSFFVALLILCIIQLIDKKKIMYTSIIGFIVGICINFHFQALGLVIVLPVISFINTYKLKQRLSIFALSVIGFIASFIPLIIFNFSHQNILFSNILNFIFGKQVSSGVENSLITDIIFFWPQLWGQTIAHLPVLGYVFILLFLVALVFALGDKKTVNKSFYSIGIIFLFQIIFMYIYQGVRSPIYLIVFHSFFIFFLGWIVLNFYHFNKYLGIGLCIAILLITLPANIAIVRNNGSQVSTIVTVKKQIDSTDRNVQILSDENSRMLALPLYYLYSKENTISESGTELIACEKKLIKDSDGVTEKWSCPIEITPIAETENYKVYKRESLSSEQQKQFSEIKSEEIYSWLYTHY